MARTLLTLDEVSAVTRVPKNTLKYWRARGDQGPNLFKLGRALVAYEDEVHAWIEAQYEATSSTKKAV